MQEIQNLSQLNQLYINNSKNQQPNTPKVDMTQKEDTFEANGQTKTLSTKKKVVIGAVVLASLAAITAAIIKRKDVSKTANEAIDEVKDLVLTRNQVDIKKGFARVDNKPFTGVIEDTVSNSNPFKYRLEYENGVLVKSIKTQGQDVLEKTYQTLEDGSQKIITNTNGAISEKTFNKKALQEAISKSNKEYGDLTFNTNNLSAEEFSKKANDIQYLNKSQKADLATTHANIVSKEQEAAKLAQEQAQKAAKEAEELAQKEAAKLNAARSYEVKLNNITKEIVDGFDEKQLSEFKDFLQNAQTIEYNHELIRHATTAENAEIIKNKGYDILHKTRNNGSNNFGGMDVEALSIADFGDRYGNTKLEYDFTGKALKLSNEMSDQFKQLVINSEDAITGESIIIKTINAGLKDPELSAGDIPNSVIRSLLKKLGYDAIAVAPKDKTLFLTILDPKNTEGLKYIRTFNV